MFQSGYSTNTKSVPTYGRRKKNVVRVLRDFNSPVSTPVKTLKPTAAPAIPPSPTPVQPAFARVKSSTFVTQTFKSPFGSPLQRPSALKEKNAVVEAGNVSKVGKTKTGKSVKPVAIESVVVEEAEDAVKENVFKPTLATRRSSSRSATASISSRASVRPTKITQRPVVLPSPPSSRETTPALEEFGDDSIIILEPETLERLSTPTRTTVSLPTPSPEAPPALAKIADDFANLSLSSSLSPLDELLRACRQSAPISFDTFFSSPTLLPPAPAGSRGSTAPRFSKVGEATYSEVFSVQQGGRGKKLSISNFTDQTVVMKVVPLVVESLDVSLHEDDDEEYEPEYSRPEDVAREINMGRLVGGLDGFLALKDAVVVQGRYPDALVDEWDDYKEAYPTKSRNACPAMFGSAQLYAILVLPYGGVDLESYVFSKQTGWTEAAAIFFGVATALAQAERQLEFEHRDLHQGQILVRPTSSTDSPLTQEGPFAPSSLQTSIIDFGLSRVSAPSGETWWTTFEDEHFEGSGGQSEVYREMRDVLGGDLKAWGEFEQKTNLMWLNYLAKTLKPTARAPAKNTRPREVEAHAALQSVQTVLQGVLSGGKKVKWQGAEGLVAWCVKQGWCA